jgi:hypothetical protein
VGWLLTVYAYDSIRQPQRILDENNAPFCARLKRWTCFRKHSATLATSVRYTDLQIKIAMEVDRLMVDGLENSHHFLGSDALGGMFALEKRQEPGL